MWGMPPMLYSATLSARHDNQHPPRLEISYQDSSPRVPTEQVCVRVCVCVGGGVGGWVGGYVCGCHLCVCVCVCVRVCV